MAQSLTLDGRYSLRYLSSFSGLGMIIASYLIWQLTIPRRSS